MKSQLSFVQTQHSLLSFPEVLLYQCPLVVSVCPFKIFYNVLEPMTFQAQFMFTLNVIPLFVFVIKFTSELGKWHSCNCLQRCKKQCMQTSLPGENVSERHPTVQLVWVNTVLNGNGKHLCSIVGTSALLFTPTRMARSQWKSRLQCNPLKV